MASVELSLAAAGSTYLLIVGTRHFFSIGAAPSTARYLPIATTPAATDNHVDEPTEKDRIREERATRDAATASDTLRLRCLIRNLLAFQLPALAASVALAVGSLVLALRRGEVAVVIGSEAAAAVSWVFAIAVTYFHFRVLASAAPGDTRAPSPVNISHFYIAYLAVAAFNLRNAPSGGQRITLIAQVIISAYLLFTDGTLLYADTRASAFAATLERNAHGRVRRYYGPVSGEDPGGGGVRLGHIGGADVNRLAPPKVCPEISAGLLSRYTYSYVTPLLEEAVNVPLEHQDIWDLNPIDDAANIEAGFKKIRATGKSLSASLSSYLSPVVLGQIALYRPLYAQ
ncbi:hypothetical protein BDK51DRAFT_37316 [Blyttiomyces helicus]|uniref:Uncharacterized protein n=1 Tax=Blyttiomyces helicus TaxID=388810 RepID=A0A4P9WCT1_9FUNG|nr:hypothetical protein BDK51DRAFT_37316 [Blyttiomyces helicus]|eukprot:RKO90324.1 hypothetical protein BDK51DRAFT_37316 [Blyttiomyces helicus]